MILVLVELGLVFSSFRKLFLSAYISDLAKDEPVAQVVGQDQVASEAVGEGLIEVENFEEAVAFDHMKVAIC